MIRNTRPRYAASVPNKNTLVPRILSIVQSMTRIGQQCAIWFQTNCHQIYLCRRQLLVRPTLSRESYLSAKRRGKSPSDVPAPFFRRCAIGAGAISKAPDGLTATRTGAAPFGSGPAQIGGELRPLLSETGSGNGASGTLDHRLSTIRQACPGPDNSSRMSRHPVSNHRAS
jgi:hypothetical protein